MLSAAEQVKEQTDCRSRLIRAAMFAIDIVGEKHGGPYQPGTAIGRPFYLLVAESTNYKDSMGM